MRTYVRYTKNSIRKRSDDFLFLGEVGVIETNDGGDGGRTLIARAILASANVKVVIG